MYLDGNSTDHSDNIQRVSKNPIAGISRVEFPDSGASLHIGDACDHGNDSNNTKVDNMS